MVIVMEYEFNLEVQNYCIRGLRLRRSFQTPRSNDGHRGFVALSARKTWGVFWNGNMKLWKKKLKERL